MEQALVSLAVRPVANGVPSLLRAWNYSKCWTDNEKGLSGSPIYFAGFRLFLGSAYPKPDWDGKYWADSRANAAKKLDTVRSELTMVRQEKASDGRYDKVLTRSFTPQREQEKAIMAASGRDTMRTRSGGNLSGHRLAAPFPPQNHNALSTTFCNGSPRRNR